MRGIRLHAMHVVTIVALVLAMCAGANGGPGNTSVLNLRAVFTGGATAGSVEITLFRWPTDAERAPLVAALSTPPSQPAAPAAPATGLAGRGGPGAASPPSRTARLEAAIKAAPTCGYIWREGVTGYSIKYAWRAPSGEGGDRIVLVTDRRLGVDASPSALTPGSPAAAAPGSPAEGDFTVIEVRLDGKGTGEGKASLNGNVVVDAAAKTLALDGYASAPTLLKVTR
jgi:hypothetical protein